MSRLGHSTLVPLTVWTVGFTTFLCCSIAAGVTASDAAMQLGLTVWGLLVVLWVSYDARRATGTPCFDFAFLVAAFFPVSVAWYCFRSRRWRGAFTFGKLLFLFILPYLAASVLWMILYGQEAPVPFE